MHARGQVISFELAWRHDEQALLRAANANLPQDIALVSLSPAAPDFHPRFDARRRAYEYYVYNRTTRSPLHRLYCWHVQRPLDLDAMNVVAGMLVGTHDFATFGQAPQGENTIREIFHARWRRDGELVVFEVQGNAFLYRMVRSIVGSMRAVGHGEWSTGDFAMAFEAANRARAGVTAPPQGLVLVSVTYD